MMNEENTKTKLKRKLSTRIASKMFPKYSRGIGYKQKWTNKKSVSQTSLSPAKSKASTVSAKQVKSSKHESKGSLRRSISLRFSIFQKRQNLPFKEGRKKGKVGEKEINIGNIGLKRQISSGLRRTLRRKHKSVTDIDNKRNNLNNGVSRKSLPDVRRLIPSKQFLNTDLHVSGKQFSIQLKSRLHSTAETIDLMDVAKPSRILKTNHSEQTAQSEKNSDNSSMIMSPLGMPEFIASPTCADLFGVDEEENGCFFYSQSIEHIYKQSLKNDMEIDPGKETSVVDINNEKKERQLKKEGDPFHRRSVTSADMCVPDVEFDNPWILQDTDNTPIVNVPMDKPRQTLLTPQISVDSLSCTSFGFVVSGLDVTSDECVGQMRRSDSRVSMDSFSSSVHSAQSQELMFSDSEAEVDMDQISISSTDSGTFDNHKLSEKSFDSDVAPKTNGNDPVAASNNKTSIQGTPRVKARRRYGVSLEETADMAGKIARKLFGKQVSTDTAIETQQKVEKSESGKDTLVKRRSLDSNLKIQQMTLDLDSNSHPRLKWTGSSDSGLSSALSPVFETSTAERRKDKKSDKTDSSHKFYTLPNRKKPKPHQSPRKKMSLESISKKLSEKAHSLSNLKLSSSFKIRNSENDASKLQTFLKTNSWTNLVVKKGAEVASNISTLMRKRSHSNNMVSSPFMPKARKSKKKQQQEEKVLIYEKVKLYRPKQTPVSKEDIVKWKKSMKLFVKIDQNRGIVSGLQSRTNSYRGLPASSLRSPTLLDEILKSVDRVRFRDCRLVDDDCEVSDEEDSSSSSSPLLFTVKPDSEGTGHSLGKNCTVCTNCGKIRYHSQQNGLSFTSRNQITRKTTHTVSLCDLHSSCSCDKTLFPRREKNLLVPNTIDSERVNDNTMNGSETYLYSRMASGMNGMCNSLISKSNRYTSMFELRNIEEVVYDSTEEDQYDGQPGSLFRSEVQHNLSDDNLDSITTGTEETQSERNCHSCEDFLSECRSRTKIVETPEVLLSPVSQFAETPDTYHSCSEFPESENYDATDETDYKKSNSCGNLMDESDVFIGNKLKEEEELKNRKEIRKAKVKSLSSSHDALNSFVPIENLTIAKDIEGVAQDVERMFGEKARLGNELNENHNVNSIDKVESTDLRSVSDHGTNIEDPVSICDSKCQKCDNKASIELSVTDKTDKCQNCAICKKLRDQDTQPDSEVPKHHKSFSDSLQVNEPSEDIGKPPLPGKQRRKFLSLNDINQNNVNIHPLDNTQTNNECVPKIPSPALLCPDNICLKPMVTDTSHSAPSTPFVHRVSTFFDFSKQDVETYSHTTLAPPLHDQERLKSVSSDNMTTGQTFNSVPERSWSGYIKHAHSDDVFSQAYQIPISPGRVLGSANHVKEFSELSPFGVFTDVPGPDVETVFKYDVGLGYLLHSLECDNQLICFYSFQRNKQLMESVITPLAALPGVSGTKVTGTGNINKGQKYQKSKCDNQPNPAAPITAVPSDKLAHAGRVIRTVLLTRAAHMIRDRKFHLRTYRRCMVGTEMVDWLIQQSPLVHSRTQAMGMWQALLEEGMVVHVCHEHQFKDEYLFYRFHEDDEGVSTVPTATTKRECEEDLQDVFLTLAQIGPDAMMRMILRKLPHERTMDDLEIIYEELLHIKALSHLSTMVKRELASVLVFESHTKSGTVLFNQGDEGKSWYIILKGSVNVVIYGKGVVCTLYEGDDFGKLALVNDAPRAATIVLRDDNCHFLRVDKDDFNRILRDVEANTVRLKEHGQDVLVLEKIPSNSQSSDGIVHTHYKYSVMAGTPEKMLEYLLESRLDSKKENEIDGFLEDFLLTHVIFMPHNHLCPVLLSHYHSSMADTSEQEAYEISLNHKKCVLHFVKEWANTVGMAFREDQTINAFLEELHSCILEDLSVYNTLKDDVVAMETILQEHNNSPECKSKRKISGNFSLTRKHSKENQSGEGVIKCKPVKPSDETIFKVYCADHTYSTLKLPMDTTVEQLLYSTKEKLGLGDDLILCEVKSTGERVVFKENDLCVISGLSINGRLFITPKEHLDALTPLPEQEGPQEGSFSTIEMMSSREMAFYMTMYDWELFTCVQEYELIYQVFGRYKFGKITANLDQFLQRFNEIQFWVITEMVLTTTLSKRVSLLRKFIKLASHCKEHQNLNSFFAIVMGLSNIAVSRLSQTWEKLPGKFKKLFAEFETLMDPSRNHRAYRLSVAKMVPPIIPFMPLLMKDMTFTHEGNKTYFDGLVNFEKMHMIAQTLKTVKFCRNAVLDLEVPGSMKSADTASYIRGLHVIDNQRLLTQLSHKVEPRKT